MARPGAAAAIVAEDAPLSTGSGAEATFATWISMNERSPEAPIARYQADVPPLPDDQLRHRAESSAGTAASVFREEPTGIRHSPRHDEIPRLAAITAPVLLIHGDIGTGGLVPLNNVSRLTATLRNSRAAQIAGGTHYLHRDRPDEFSG